MADGTDGRYLTVCKTGKNYLVKEDGLSSFMSMPNTRLGPCKMVAPSPELRDVCFPGTGKHVCKDPDCVGLSVPCYDGPVEFMDVGECAHGYITCVRVGRISSCTGSVLPNAETCDGRDEDCDGVVDNGFNVGGRCEKKHGLCSSQGKLECAEDGVHTKCSAEEIFPEKEVCWDGRDNDCNGLIDCFDPVCKNATRECYTGPAGTLGQGICASGRTVCLGQGKLSECAGQTLPSPEVCDGVDNDCNGEIDEPPLIGVVEGEEECLHGKLHGCKAKVYEGAYLSIMSKMMEKFPAAYEKLQRTAARNSDDGHDSSKHATEMFLWGMSMWISSHCPEHEIMTLPNFTITFGTGEAVTTQDFTPGVCEMWPDLDTIVQRFESAMSAVGAESMPVLLTSAKVRIELLNPRCLHEMCPDGKTLKSCTEAGFGGNCS